MKIAICSDSHDHIPHLREGVMLANDHGCTALIHCGDLISPFMLEELARFAGAVHLIYGNNAGDQHLIASLIHHRFPSITHHGVFGAIEAGGRRIAFHHYPAMARNLARSGAFDVVCCGHDHTYLVERVGTTLLVNPGELLGKEARPSFAVLETSNLEVVRLGVGRPLFPPPP